MPFGLFEVPCTVSLLLGVLGLFLKFIVVNIILCPHPWLSVILLEALSAIPVDVKVRRGSYLRLYRVVQCYLLT
jgi:hypothetical protein